jgi:hypothetical protein
MLQRVKTVYTSSLLPACAVFYLISTSIWFNSKAYGRITFRPPLFCPSIQIVTLRGKCDELDKIPVSRNRWFTHVKLATGLKTTSTQLRQLNGPKICLHYISSDHFQYAVTYSCLPSFQTALQPGVGLGFLYNTPPSFSVPCSVTYSFCMHISHPQFQLHVQPILNS